MTATWPRRVRGACSIPAPVGLGPHWPRRSLVHRATNSGQISRLRVDLSNDIVMTRPRASVPADAGATLGHVSLLSPPTEEMLAAASALVRDPDKAPQVSDQKLQLAIEIVMAGFGDYERRVCADMAANPLDSEAREALELALAQRISSARLSLGVDPSSADAQEDGASSSPVEPTGRRSQGRRAVS